MRIVVCIAAVLMALSLVVVQQCVADDRAIYDGRSVEELGITLGAWGSGTAQETMEEVISGRAIKIISEGFYSGGRIDFATPVRIYGDDPLDNLYLRFMISFKGRQEVRNLDEYGEPILRPIVGNVRLVLYPEASDQKPIETIVPVATIDMDAWWPIAVPLVTLKSLAQTEELKIKRILVFSDMPDTMYLGEIRIIRDAARIAVDPVEPQPTSPTSYDYVVFSAVARGGLAPLIYSWDFDKRDGIQDDAFGEQIVKVFGRQGDYEVTLTVRDAFGVKESATTSVKVFVND